MNHHHHQKVKNLHNSVANSSDPALSTVRPPGTTMADLNRVAQSIRRNLKLKNGSSLLDIGCGNGLLSSHFLSECSRYVGIDYSSDCLDVFKLRLVELDSRTKIELIDIDATTTFPDIGKFDRVLAYASFHYVESEQEATDTLLRLISCVKKDGYLLLGNLPLTDLQNIAFGKNCDGNFLVRFFAKCKWLFSSDLSVIGPKWKITVVFDLLRRKIKRAISSQLDLEKLPPLEIQSVEFTLDKFQDWLQLSKSKVRSEFLPTCSRAPLAIGRADLLIQVLE